MTAHSCLTPTCTIEELVQIAISQPDSFGERRALMVIDIERRLSNHAGLEQSYLALALDAMRSTPREHFVPSTYENLAYLPMAGDIGHGQSISNPVVIAAMIAAIRPGPSSRVLEVGTGSGYQAALLSQIVREVVSVEIVPVLAALARNLLEALGCSGVQVVQGDAAADDLFEGYFDGVIVAAGCQAVPSNLLERLTLGGRLVAPVGPTQDSERLTVFEQADGGVRAFELGAVEFVPLSGRGSRAVEQLASSSGDC